MVARLSSVVLALLLVGACVRDGDEHAAGESGAAMFRRYCSDCHGTDGAGSFLRGVPSNRSTALSVSEIADRILEDAPAHREMPSFPKLTRAEALAIATHVDQLRDASDGRRAFWEHGPASAPPAASGASRPR
jgi:mono/diheme cytochrome c family protein